MALVMPLQNDRFSVHISSKKEFKTDIKSNPDNQWNPESLGWDLQPERSTALV